VTFGTPRHRGATGGKECERAFGALCDAIAHEFREHDVLIRALALHYHLGAMHPFLDGNGRTARAVEALMLQRAGLRDALFIALSNYYYEEKSAYLAALASVRQANGDLTEFVLFGLRGMTLQCQKLLAMINESIYKVLYKDVANDLFNRLQSKKKRVIAKRQLTITSYILDNGAIRAHDLFKMMRLRGVYTLKDNWAAFVRDVSGLANLSAISLRGDNENPGNPIVSARLQWPTEITDTEFFKRTREMPRAKTFAYLETVPPYRLPMRRRSRLSDDRAHAAE